MQRALAFGYSRRHRPYLESIPFKCSTEQREARAFDNMLKAIDMQEMFERLAINNHKSFLPHLTVYKVCFSCACVFSVSSAIDAMQARPCAYCMTHLAPVTFQLHILSNTD